MLGEKNELKNRFLHIGAQSVILSYSLINVIGCPLVMWLIGKVHSWEDLFLYAATGLILAIFGFAPWLFGWIKPKKDE